MKIHAIFYTDKKYRKREAFLLNRLREVGFDEVINYRREWLEGTDFYFKHRDVLDSAVGGGYWLWKPYIIIETLSKVSDGDVVFYMDAGDNIYNRKILRDIRKYMSSIDYMIAGRYDRDLNYMRTKRDCFILMECDDALYYHKRQIEAGTLAFKKTEDMKRFLDEWLFYCKDINIISDSPSVLGEDLNGFIGHRHDQSILTNLVCKYNMKYSGKLYSRIKYNAFNGE